MPQIRCKHKWRVLNKEVFSSFWEQLSPDERMKMIEVLVGDIPERMINKKIESTLVCDTCGKRDRQTVESTSAGW